MPLVLANTGEENIVRKIGGSPEVRQHLADLGFNVGAAVTIVSAMGGNVIVKVKESRVAISKETARKIMIETLRVSITQNQKLPQRRFSPAAEDAGEGG